MRRLVVCVACFAVLAAPLLLADPIMAGEPKRCPPTGTQTLPSPNESSLVLADASALVPVKLTDAFEVPWSFAFLPDGSFLVTERPGRLQHVSPGGAAHKVAGVPAVLYDKHGGLLDVAIDPAFEINGLIYLSYLQGDLAASTMRVMRARFDADKETLADQQIIFESNAGPKTDQIGGRLALTGDGHLFLTLGDLWEGDRAQDLSDHHGAIIRIRTDGSIPEDNPFRRRVDAKPEIWSYGHRNPQGLAFDRVTGLLWEHEHGPQGGDELNLVLRAHDYGWPLATYGVDYSGRPIAVNSLQPGTEQPVNYWVPISIAPSGLAVETGASGVTTIWMGALAGQMLVQLTLVDNCVVSERHLLKHQFGRIRDVRIGPSGDVYVLPEGGGLYRLESPPDGQGPDKARL